jgi:cytochrome c oxidase assembly protein subunit 15
VQFAFLQILLGALVAGIDAGRGYTDWPLMAGGLFPPGMWELQPLWRNLFENDGTVQFIHRVAGYLLLVMAVFVWLRARRSPHPAIAAAGTAMIVAMAAQVGLGIVTVINGAPWYLGIAHQGLAVVLFVLAIRLRFLAGHPPGELIRGRT